jgi:hypothetical protein
MAQNELSYSARLEFGQEGVNARLKMILPHKARKLRAPDTMQNDAVETADERRWTQIRMDWRASHPDLATTGDWFLPLSTPFPF